MDYCRWPRAWGAWLLFPAALALGPGVASVLVVGYTVLSLVVVSSPVVAG